MKAKLTAWALQLLWLVTPYAHGAVTFTTLVSFNGTNGSTPRAGLARGTDGKFYGTTYYGGAYMSQYGFGYGTLFQMNPDGAVTTLTSFNNTNGSQPEARLVQASDGRFYGTTFDAATGPGKGTVFRITTEGMLTTLYSFTGSGGDGEFPHAGLALGRDGSLYGTTSGGGTNGWGTVFRIDTNGTLNYLTSFSGFNGANPHAGLVQGSDGNFYGTTFSGGTFNKGTVFSVSTNGALTTLVSFNGTNGSQPEAGLVQGSDGNFYGTTFSDGTFNKGTVFSMSTNGALTTLVSFNGTNGSQPEAGLVQGSDGNFYGATINGGTMNGGTIYRMSPAGALTALFSFNGTNGYEPFSPAGELIQDIDGSFCGTTQNGGTNGNGTVFRLTVSDVPPLIPLVVRVDGVWLTNGEVSFVDSAQVIMGSSFGTGAGIYYTLDGTPPDFTGLLYTGAFSLTNNATIWAIAYNLTYADWAVVGPIEVQIWPTYPLTTSTPGGGSVSLFPAPYSAGNRYVSNTVVTLTATPSTGWSFMNWTGDSTDTTNITLLMNRPRTVQAVFGTTLNLFTNGNGEVLVNPPAAPYAFGSTVQLTALPASGSYFFGWAGAANGFTNPLAFTVTNASGITALFGVLRSNQVSLTVLPSGSGTVGVSPSNNVYTNGDTVTMTAAPGTNYLFSGWSGDASGNLNPMVVTLDASKFIMANFVSGTPTNPPVITQQPASRTLATGSDTTLSFRATGDGPFSYQWRFNDSPVPGGTNGILTLTRITPTQAGLYNVVLTGPAGTATSALASVALFGMGIVPSQYGPVPLLTLDGASGTSYHIDFSADLSHTNWALLSPVTIEGNRFSYVDDATTNHPKRFYRAVPQ